MKWLIARDFCNWASAIYIAVGNLSKMWKPYSVEGSSHIGDNNTFINALECRLLYSYVYCLNWTEEIQFVFIEAVI